MRETPPSVISHGGNISLSLPAFALFHNHEYLHLEARGKTFLCDRGGDDD